jgi:NTE family protein
LFSPSEELERIASRHADELPRTIRILLYTVGAMKRSGSNLLSYLLFEKSCCRALIQPGYQDTAQRGDDLLTFLSG